MLIGLVIVTHGQLAAEFRRALEHVVGPQDAMEVICIEADDDIEKRRTEIIEAIEVVNSGDGVLVLTDMFGGTPSNLAISAMEPGKPIDVIAGINLPMLVKLTRVRSEMSLSDCAQAASDAARKYITVASSMLTSA